MCVRASRVGTDVPPLEDMSEFLAARKGPTAEPQPIAISVATTPAAAAAPVPASTVSAVAPPTSTVAAVAPAAPAAVAKAKPSSGFGGFSKGFLSGGSKPKPAAPTQPAPARDIPVLTAKKDKSDSLRLPELMEQTKSGTRVLHRVLRAGSIVCARSFGRTVVRSLGG